MFFIVTLYFFCLLIKKMFFNQSSHLKGLMKLMANNSLADTNLDFYSSVFLWFFFSFNKISSYSWFFSLLSLNK